MSEQEYKQKLSDLKNQFDKDKQKIDREYALSKNPYKIGDIVKDHHSILKIESVKWGYCYGGVDCIFKGVELKIDLTPSKKQLNTEMWLDNVKEKLN